MLPDQVLSQLKAIVGPQHVLLESEDLKRCGVDRTTLWQANPCAVVLPSAVTMVQKIIRLANDCNLAVVPSGGRTGLSGGAVASDGELIIALDRINTVIDFNAIDRAVTVGAGMITADLQAFAAKHDLLYPVDFAAAGSSQIGGNIATNAGGINVIRYGMTRDWVIGLKVVTGAGDILDLNQGLLKNNTGYDFRHLFIGSEGTLGLICEATLQLTRPQADTTVMVLGIETFAAIVEVLEVFKTKIELTAFEFFSQAALDKVIKRQGHSAPFATQAPFYALIEFETREQVTSVALALFEQCAAQGWVLDGVVSQSLAQTRALWRLREDISETLWHWQPYKNDISVRVSKMSDFLAEVDQLVAARYPDFEIVWYGHIGDGNLHLNILKPEDLPQTEFFERCGIVSLEIGELLARYGGSISAEHGVGLLKKSLLPYSRSPVEIALMRSIKKTFDPKSILNPGKVFDALV